jgi:heptosyltransferase III
VPTQTDTLDRLGSGSRVAIIRLRSLGDCVLATSAIHLLKQTRPDLLIAVVVEERFAPVFQNNRDIAEVLPPRAGALRSFAPMLCLNLHGGSRSARLTALSGAKIRAGFNIFRPRWVYNLRIPTAQETMEITRRVHTAEHLASAMFYLGVPIAEVPRARLDPGSGGSVHAPGRPYAVIHPLAATPEKTWSAESFRELARYFEQSMGLDTVFIGGPDEDLSAFEPRRTVPGAPLGDVMKLMRGAAFFAGNDSGPAHVAAAFGVPQIVFFGPSDPEVWAPWRTSAEILKAEGGIQNISVARAIEACVRLRVAA